MAEGTRLMIVAGEASGDKHGAHLVAALRALRPDWEFFGAGGDEMRAAGVETIVDAREMAIMGAFEVAAALPRFLAAFRHLRAAASERAARATILIDWPEFNLRLAKRLRRDGHRVFYYISPQVWAWRGYRVGAIRRDIERMLVILPFERDFYARSGVEVDYVGHPLLDSVSVSSSRAEFCARHLLRAEAPLVALLPGSRRSELKYILPPLVESARHMAASDPSLQFVLPLAPAILPAQIRTDFDPPPSVHLVAGETYDAIAAADLAVVASGTATLETALIGTPLIVVYRASALNWRLFRPLISVSQVGLPNLIAGRQIVPELLQDELSAARLAPMITELLGDPARLARQREDLAAVRARLGQPHASQRAAQRLVTLIEADERKI